MTRYPAVPWGTVEPCDLDVAQSGLYSRDVRFSGVRERQYALHVVGSVHRGLSLGLVAIRCARDVSGVVPLTLSIPDAPEV